MRPIFWALLILVVFKPLVAELPTACQLQKIKELQLEEGVALTFQKVGEGATKKFEMEMKEVRPGIRRAITTITIGKDELKFFLEEKKLNTLSYTLVATVPKKEDILAISKITVNGQEASRIGLIFKTPKKIFNKNNSSYELFCDVRSSF